jgi:tetratricopeptide (TPR) repeat protein
VDLARGRASVLQAQGKYDQAEPLYRRAIEIDERGLGRDHPNVATNYNNLAELLRAQGKYDQAEPLYRRAIEIGEPSMIGSWMSIRMRSGRCFAIDASASSPFSASVI